jgi:hypothetical protein
MIPARNSPFSSVSLHCLHFALPDEAYSTKQSDDERGDEQTTSSSVYTHTETHPSVRHTGSDRRTRPDCAVTDRPRDRQGHRDHSGAGGEQRGKATNSAEHAQCKQEATEHTSSVCVTDLRRSCCRMEVERTGLRSICCVRQASQRGGQQAASQTRAKGAPSRTRRALAPTHLFLCGCRLLVCVCVCAARVAGGARQLAVEREKRQPQANRRPQVGSPLLFWGLSL